jgi:hypothetical protein
MLCSLLSRIPDNGDKGKHNNSDSYLMWFCMKYVQLDMLREGFFRTSLCFNVLAKKCLNAIRQNVVFLTYIKIYSADLIDWS